MPLPHCLLHIIYKPVWTRPHSPTSSPSLTSFLPLVCRSRLTPTPCCFRCLLLSLCPCSLIEKSVLRDDSHATCCHPCAMCPPITRRCSDQYGQLSFSVGRPRERPGGSHRTLHMQGRLGSFQTVRAKGQLPQPLLGDPTVSSWPKVQ